ncbi:MAG: ParB N-terminal domain-containing protein [Deltaproteobacteria bacterium]|nr:ParB N-terminal domain-containing protein [Deltaproteobacteria bacterium]
MKLKIPESLTRLPKIDYRNVLELQGDLKDLTKANYDRLKKSLQTYGFIVPLFIWRDGTTVYAVDGHQRLRVLKKENAEPHALPFVEIEARTETEARQKLLVISSQYGTITPEGFDAFTADIDNAWLSDTVHFDAFNFEIPKNEDFNVDDAPRLDEQNKNEFQCPECGHRFCADESA